MRVGCSLVRGEGICGAGRKQRSRERIGLSMAFERERSVIDEGELSPFQRYGIRWKRRAGAGREVREDERAETVAR